MIFDTTINNTIVEQILVELDGWSIDNDVEDYPETIPAFLDSTELSKKTNKSITLSELTSMYESTLDQAFLFTNRTNSDAFSDAEGNLFLRGVCKWTASNLWNKYNIRVNNEEMEDTTYSSYGGLLYHSAMSMLKPFILQRITGLSKYNSNNSEDMLDIRDSVWYG